MRKNMDDLERRFVFALQQTSGAWRMDLERRVKWSGLSQTEWLLLDAIAFSGNGAPQAELACQIGERYSTTAQMIRRLAAAGLVAQIMSREDKRAKLVHITGTGRTLHQQVKPDVERMHRDLLSMVSRAQLSTAIAVLESVRRLADGSNFIRPIGVRADNARVAHLPGSLHGKKWYLE